MSRPLQNPADHPYGALQAPYDNWSTRGVRVFFNKLVRPALVRRGVLAAGGEPPVAVQHTLRSTLYCCRDGDEAYAVKIIGPASPPFHSAQRAFDSLAFVHRQDPQGATIGVPAPVAVLPELAIFVTRWIDAPTLSVFLSTATAPEQLAAVTATARWLADFHALRPVQMRPFEARIPIGSINRELRRGIEPLPGPDTPRFNRGYKRRIAAARALDGTAVPMVTAHGDAKSDNFMVDGAKIYGLDFCDHILAEPVKDLARLSVEASLRLAPRRRGASP